MNKVFYLLAAILSMPMIGHAQTAPDCSKLSAVTSSNEAADMDPKLLKQCQNLGWEPPVSLRKSAGQSVSGRGGFSISARRAPEDPPSPRNAKPSVSGAAYNLSLKLPPWSGFPCQLPLGPNLCGGGGSSSSPDTAGNANNGLDANGNPIPGAGTSASCAIADDTTGTFGTQQTVTSGTPASLSCGGSVPLSSYRISLNPSPNHLFITNAGGYDAWTYRQSGTNFALASAASLPRYLCHNPSGDDEIEQRRVLMRPPMAQMITYAQGASSIAVRLQPEDPGDVADPFYVEPYDPEAGPIEPEKYLILPVVGGVPQIPGDCAQVATYYRAPTIRDTIIIEPAHAAGCSGVGLQCADQTTVPTGTSNCETATLTPSSKASDGSDVCAGKMQIAVLDRPNLLYPAPSSATIIELAGDSPIALAATIAGSRLYTPSDSVIYLGDGGPSFLLPEGAVVKLDNGNQLRMNAPAIINASTRSATLTGGGAILTESGGLVQEIPENGSIGIAATPPLTLRLGRNMELPAGFLIPTQPNPYVRLPIATE